MLCDLSEQRNTRNILHNLDLAYVIGKFKWEHSFELYLIKNRLAGSFFHAKPEEFGGNTDTFQNKDSILLGYNPRQLTILKYPLYAKY